MILFNERNRLLTVLPSVFALARVAKNLLALGFKLEVQTDVELGAAVVEHHARCNLGQGQARHVQPTIDGMSGHVYLLGSFSYLALENVALEPVAWEELCSQIGQEGRSALQVATAFEESPILTAIRMVRLPFS